jgi:hypothetical protein
MAPALPRSGRRLRVAVGAALVVIVAVGVIAFGIARSHQKSTTSTTAVSGGRQSGPITFSDFPSKMGISTGAQLWQSEPSQIDSEIAGIAATGTKWLRTALHWKDVEADSANVDDWSKADLILADAQKAGLSVIWVVDSAPNWAGAAQSGEFSSDPKLYADFVAKVAARYRGKVRVYELGNEPNHSDYVKNPSAESYTKILQAAYPAIKAADPDAFVLTGGLGGTGDKNGNIDGLTFTRELYQDGAKGYFDAIAYHPYTYPQLPTQDATVGGRSWSLMLQVRSVMVQNGDASKPIWITEFGAPTQGAHAVSEAQQAVILQNGFQLWKTYSWGGVISWFTYQDTGTDATSHVGWFGLVSKTGTHKAAYATYQALTHTS